ncbi:MAG: hypothetical protein HFJ24_01000 [Clostridia bacterium]|nr:hypothetical protein [Clostridia bacterium]MCI9274652.1 hypothetical protein [Clostridia bacterium]
MLGIGRYEKARLDDLKVKRAHVVINLMSGKIFEGTIHEVDDAVVVLDLKDAKGGRTRQTIYRHAIETFHTTSDIDVFSTTSDSDAFRV